MRLYEMDKVKGHVVVDAEGVKCLVDTGSPLTFGDVKKFKWDGQTIYPQPENLWGVGIEQIREMGDIDFDVLVGTDLLQRKPFQIDTHRGEFVLGDLNGAPKYDIVCWRGSPRTELEVNGIKGNALIDTGAVKSFFQATPEWGLSEGEHEDFYPTLGKFKAPQWKVPVTVFGHTMPLDVVEPPEILRNMLGMIGAHGILGMDILRYGALGFDLQGGKASFERYEDPRWK
jgi:hypothetical protein